MPAVPVFNELSSCYGSDVSERYQAVGKAFKAKYGQDPVLFTRAPGRVNLIGEHIDYEGYGVLPMAINQDTIVAIAKGGDKLALGNLQSELYPDAEFSTDPNQGVYDLLASKGLPAPEATGLQVMMHGTVPLGSGLSSSAAFVCSCFLAILAVHDISAGQEEVAEFAARAERHVGVSSGGMDQAISMMGMQGVAKKVDFNPVRSEDVLLPAGAIFVIGNSLAVSKKAVGAHKRYNLRVVECRLAAALLAHALGAPQDVYRSVKTLLDVEPLVAEKLGKFGLSACAEAVQQFLKQDLYTHEEVEVALGASPESLYAGSPVALRAVGGAKEDGGFKLRQRALHVYQEAQRSDASDEDKLTQLGKLMDASHTSCAELYECSCPELDALTSQARAAGALGSRLTGAGWGGCTVSLVCEADVHKFLQAVGDSYYAAKIGEGLVTKENLGHALFASKPSSGAAVLRIKL